MPTTHTLLTSPFKPSSTIDRWETTIPQMSGVYELEVRVHAWPSDVNHLQTFWLYRGSYKTGTVAYITLRRNKIRIRSVNGDLGQILDVPFKPPRDRVYRLKVTVDNERAMLEVNGNAVGDIYHYEIAEGNEGLGEGLLMLGGSEKLDDGTKAIPDELEFISLTYERVDGGSNDDGNGDGEGDNEGDDGGNGSGNDDTTDTTTDLDSLRTILLQADHRAKLLRGNIDEALRILAKLLPQ